VEPKKPAFSSKSGPEKASGPWRQRNNQVLWVIGIVVALLTTALLIVNLHPKIWKGLLEERNLTLMAIGVNLTAIIVLLAIGGATRRWTGFRRKTVWDWMDLLIVPLVLVVIGLVFTMLQDARQQDLENQRAEQAQKIENQRAEAERELAVQRAQDEALQAYLDQMSGLLLVRNLRASEEDTEVRTLARARTQTALERLDPSRKTALMQFLVEADLLRRVDGRDPIISLRGADLSDAMLFNAELSGANLRFANLSEADLSGASLRGADLFLANLRGARLRFAGLSGATLIQADLSGANLREDNLSEADLFLANLRGANLRGANLRGTLLHGANLTKANLQGADLEEAILRGAYLGSAVGITNEELEQQAKTLKGATMPNGQKYEDWLKDPGQLHTTRFEPALSYDISGGLKFTRETTDELLLEGLERGQLIFASPTRVFDPSSPSEPTKVSAPENVDEWASWFQRHPNLDTSEPVSVSVGGADGMQIDVTLSSTPENYPRDLCGEHCVALFPPGIISSTKGFKDRFIIVEVEGKPVVIDVSAASAENKFEDFLPKAQKMLDTVEWKSE
jgi:uncharacterized protein YjbI with pentapeptide repeats